MERRLRNPKGCWRCSILLVLSNICDSIMTLLVLNLDNNNLFAQCRITIGTVHRYGVRHPLAWVRRFKAPSTPESAIIGGSGSFLRAWRFQTGLRTGSVGIGQARRPFIFGLPHLTVAHTLHPLLLIVNLLFILIFHQSLF